MHARELERRRPSHNFLSDPAQRGEQRTWLVIGLTLVTMVVEIVAGAAYGSMALLADGWHMGTHAAAFGITAFAYAYARKNRNNPRFTFGTGKVSALGGFASATALAVVAVLMVVESIDRILYPVTIHFEEALLVAGLGLLVNLVSAVLLGGGHTHAQPHDDHVHAHDPNLRAAYLHVLADALTSVLAIGALLVGATLGVGGLDPVVGLIGGAVILKWAFDLTRSTARVLLDAEVDPRRVDQMRRDIERDSDNRVADLHVWRVGPHHLAGIVSVVTHDPKTPEHYKALVAEHDELVHLTVEVHRCCDAECA